MKNLIKIDSALLICKRFFIRRFSYFSPFFIFFSFLFLYFTDIRRSFEWLLLLLCKCLRIQRCVYLLIVIHTYAAAQPGFRFGGNILGGRPGRGSGGGAPRTPENFRKFAKKIIKKITINAQF